MKVLFCIRGDYSKSFAEDSIQVIKTAENLKKIGVYVDINSGDIIDYSNYDIIHLFNLGRMGETYKYYKMAHYYKKNIVITPLYWNMQKYYKYINDMESMKLWEKCNIYRKEILKGCSMIYPSSKIEKYNMENDFSKKLPYTVAHSGIEIENEDTPLYNFKERNNLDNYVLCVGSICPEKNQLKLAEICNKIGIQLVIIGNINNKNYFNKCIKYKNVTYLSFNDNYNIYNAYRFAKVHVTPSFVELPGFYSLKAAASGCSIISTKEGCAEEYFHNIADYCDPYNEKSIYNAIEKGLKKTKNDKLKLHVLENYNWEKYTKIIYDSYLKILK